MGALQSVPGEPEYSDLAEKTGCKYPPCYITRFSSS